MSAIPLPAMAIAELKIDELVRGDVASEIPRHDQSVHTESEENLRSHVVNKYLDNAHKMRQEALDEQAELRNSINIRELDKDISNTETIVGQKLSQKLSDLKTKLATTAGDYGKALRDLNVFKDENKLNREAIYEEHKVLHYALIFLIVIGETLLNTVFLSKGSELGIIGGFVSALIISAANFLAALLMSITIRGIFHINVLHKLLSALATFALIVLAGYFILGVGHYREALELDPFTASRIAGVKVLESPLGIEDFNAWILVVVSALAVVLLTLKFFRVEDRYPGFTKLTRIMRTKRSEWEKACEQAREEVAGVIENAQKKVTQDEHNIRAQFATYRSSLNKSEQIIANYEEDKNRAQRLVEELIRQYQTRSERLMGRRPPYFGEILNVERDQVPPLNIVVYEQHQQELESLERIIAGLEDNYSGAINKVNERRSSIQAEVDSTIEQIRAAQGIGKGK